MGEVEFDLVVDAGADARQLAAALKLVAPGGRCHSVGIYFGDRIMMPVSTMFMNGTTFTTSRADVGPSIPHVLDLLATGTVDPLPIYSHEIAWDDAPTSARSGLPTSRSSNANACSPRPVDLCDEIEEAGKVSELTVEAQGGITVNTNTKDGDSGAGIEA